MPTIDFSKETKLPRSAIFFLSVKKAKHLFKAIWAIATIVLFKILSEGNLLKSFYYTLIIIGGILLFAVVLGLLQYFYFTYYIADKKLTVKEGFLKKSVMSIPVNRIQNISIKQSFWQQILEITTLSVDSAGSSENELEIYLDLATSNELKAYLESCRITKSEQRTNTQKTDNNISFTEKEKRLSTYAYDTKKLINASISRNHLRGFIFLGASVLALASQLDEKILLKLIDKLWAIIFPYFSEIHSIFSWILLLFAVLLLVVIFNVVNTILKYYKLKVTLREDNVQFQAGLLSRMEQIIHLDKIQIVKKSTNPIEKWLGLSTLTLLQFLTKKRNDQKEKLTFSLPGFHKTDELVNEIYSDLSKDEPTEYLPTKRFLIRNSYLFLLTPFVALSALLFIDWQLFYIPLLWLPVGFLLASQRYKNSKTEIGKKYLTVHSGILSRISETIKIINIQKVVVRQSVFQKRRNVATLTIATRWRQLVIPFIKTEDANAIANYILYILESGKVDSKPALSSDK